MPAQTWINFEKDVLYLLMDFCLVAMEGFPTASILDMGRTFLENDMESPCGYFLDELSQDIRKVKDLAVRRLWNIGPQVRDWWFFTMIIADFLGYLDRFTMVDDSYHPPDQTADMVFDEDYASLSEFSEQEWRSWPLWIEYPDEALDRYSDRRVQGWDGVDLLPWIEFGAFVRREDRVSGSQPGVRPRRQGGRLIRHEDRRRRATYWEDEKLNEMESDRRRRMAGCGSDCLHDEMANCLYFTIPRAKALSGAPETDWDAYVLNKDAKMRAV